MVEIIRVLRVLEYEGPREWVEKTLSERCIKGERSISDKAVIREAIVGETPTVMTISYNTPYDRARELKIRNREICNQKARSQARPRGTWWYDERGNIVRKHASDCAVYNEPALPRGECDCDCDARGFLHDCGLGNPSRHG